MSSLANFKRADASTTGKFRVFDLFDLPNILSDGAETGSMAFSNDAVYYKSSTGWTPMAGVTNIQTDGNVVVSQSGGNVVISLSSNVVTGGGGGNLSPNVSVDNLRFPFTSPDLLMRRSGPQNLLLTSNTGGNAAFESSTLISNVITSSSSLIISPTGPSIDFTNKDLVNAHIPPIFIGSESEVGFNTAAEQPFFSGGGQRGSFTIPNAYFNRSGRGFKLEAYLRVFYGGAGSFTFRGSNNSALILSSVVSSPGLGDQIYKLEMTLLCTDVAPPKATAFTITLTSISDGNLVSYSEGPGIAINGDYVLNFTGQFSSANSGNNARLMRMTILQI